MVISAGKIISKGGKSFLNEIEFTSKEDINLEYETVDNYRSITSLGRICIKVRSALNNIGNAKIDGRVVNIEGNVSNSEQATIRGSESLTLPASLIQSLVGAECVTAEAVNSMQKDLATRGGSLIGSTLTVNPLR